MKTSLIFCLCLFAQIGFAQTEPRADTDYFDPQTDPVARMDHERPRLMLSEELIMRAVVVKFPSVGRVERVGCQFIEGRWWLTLESRHADDMEQSVFLAIRLKPDDEEQFFADYFWTACTGEGCGGCDFKLQMDGCFCRFDRPGDPGIPGACYQTTSDEPLMVKVPLRASKSN